MRCSKNRKVNRNGYCTACQVRVDYESRDPVACLRCEKTRRPFSKGLCKSCYQALRRNPDAARSGSEEHRAALRAAHKPGSTRRENSGRWKGGRFLDCDGYVRVLPPDGYAGKLIHGGRYVAEHRLVAEQSLGRLLLPGEVVHHINRRREDNDPANLLVLPSISVHRRLHVLEERLKSPGRFRSLQELPFLAGVAIEKPHGVGDGVNPAPSMSMMHVAEDHEATFALSEIKEVLVGVQLGLWEIVGDLSPINL